MIRSLTCLGLTNDAACPHARLPNDFPCENEFALALRVNVELGQCLLEWRLR
jgi:hypothetical protein